jgi:aspartate oxidase
MVENAPDAIASLEEIGVLFTQEDGQYHLTTEGVLRQLQSTHQPCTACTNN